MNRVGFRFFKNKNDQYLFVLIEGIPPQDKIKLKDKIVRMVQLKFSLYPVFIVDRGVDIYETNGVIMQDMFVFINSLTYWFVEYSDIDSLLEQFDFESHLQRLSENQFRPLQDEMHQFVPLPSDN